MIFESRQMVENEKFFPAKQTIFKIGRHSGRAVKRRRVQTDVFLWHYARMRLYRTLNTATVHKRDNLCCGIYRQSPVKSPDIKT